MEEGKNAVKSSYQIWSQAHFFPSSYSGSMLVGEKETQMTGIYDLAAVLTHKGRSADSGHYVAWVKQENGSFFETNPSVLVLSGLS